MPDKPYRKLCGPNQLCFKPREDLKMVCISLKKNTDEYICKEIDEIVTVYMPCITP